MFVAGKFQAIGLGDPYLSLVFPHGMVAYMSSVELAWRTG
jgi:hypothetical protein